MGDRIAALNCFRQALNARTQTDNPQAPQLYYQTLQSSVICDPTFAEGWAAVGDANMGYDRLAGAIYAYMRALELPCGTQDGDLTPRRAAQIRVALSEVLRRSGRLDEAEEEARRAIAYDDHLAYAWLNLSQVLSAAGDLGGSLEAAERGYELDPNDCKLEMGLAFAQMFVRNMSEGLRHFEARFAYKIPAFLNYPMPKWDGTAGKSLFLVADQGIGDTLSFARFVKAACARCSFVHMAVQPELLRLFAASFQGVTNLNIVPLPCPFPPAEAWSTFVSLPTALGLSDDEIINAPGIMVPPFVSPNTAWKSPDRQMHIGVAWAGSPANAIDIFRSFPVTDLLTLYEAGPGIQLYSLQIGERAADLHNAGCAALIRDLSPYVRDVSDTIGLIKHLDLIISVESALAHICAMMGRECWVPYAFHGREFRIGHDGSDAMWCPQHRIFKQDSDATWPGVFESIRDALSFRLEQREAAE